MSRIRGATLIELLVVLAWATSIWFAASWGYDMFSWGGLVIGVVLAGVLPPTALNALSYLENFFWGGIPRRPRCRNGKCIDSDYKYVRHRNGEYESQCKCGDFYRKEGRRFLRLQPDGSTDRYLRWVPFKGWMDDEVD